MQGFTINKMSLSKVGEGHYRFRSITNEGYNTLPGCSEPPSQDLPSAYSCSTAEPRRPGKSPLMLKPFLACK
jgi:hypothetical protein